MINYDLVYQRAAAYRKKFGMTDPRNVIEYLGITPLPFPFGTGEDAMKGFIQKNNRCVTIAYNSDASDEGQILIVSHEIGHFVMRHLDSAPNHILRDTRIGYDGRRSMIADTENESNFFVAETRIDTKEAIEAIHEYDIKTAAAQLYVPVEFLDLKLRMMNYQKIVNAYNDSFYAGSDAMRNIDCNATRNW